jgi:hypothetical protein
MSLSWKNFSSLHNDCDDPKEFNEFIESERDIDEVDVEELIPQQKKNELLSIQLFSFLHI